MCDLSFFTLGASIWPAAEVDKGDMARIIRMPRPFASPKSDSVQRENEKEKVARVSFFRPQIGRDYPLNLSISLSGGKETNKDSLSNGE